MYCFYRVISPIVAFIDIVNHLYNERQIKGVSIVNLNMFAN